jgi:hypothetical protein
VTFIFEPTLTAVIFADTELKEIINPAAMSRERRSVLFIGI